MTQVLLNSKLYDVQLPELCYDLVSMTAQNGSCSQFLHPVDALRLGVHNGGYFWSKQSLQVHEADLCMPAVYTYFNLEQRRLLQSGKCSSYREPLTKLGSQHHNYFGVSASSSYEEWQINGWIQPGAPEGWFEAYTQQVLGGLRDYETDWQLELRRYTSFAARHAGQIKANPTQPRLKQRQALLNWASPLAFIV